MVERVVSQADRRIVDWPILCLCVHLKAKRTFWEEMGESGDVQRKERVMCVCCVQFNRKKDTLSDRSIATVFVKENVRKLKAPFDVYTHTHTHTRTHSWTCNVFFVCKRAVRKRLIGLIFRLQKHKWLDSKRVCLLKRMLSKKHRCLHFCPLMNTRVQLNLNQFSMFARLNLPPGSWRCGHVWRGSVVSWSGFVNLIWDQLWARYATHTHTNTHGYSWLTVVSFTKLVVCQG